MKKVDQKLLARVLNKNPSILFAYLYGSVLEADKFNDIDIAVYLKPGFYPFRVSADLKMELSQKMGIDPDKFDVQVINGLLEKGDILSLIYLKNILENGDLIVDKDENLRTSFVEAYGMKYRECEGLIVEVLV